MPTTNTAFQLSEAFWRELVDGHWQKKPGSFAQPSSTPFASPEDVFDALVGALERVRRGELERNLRPYVDGKLTRAADDIGPVKSDGSLSGYVERMRRTHDDKPFALVVNNAQVLHETIWRNTLAVVHEYRRRIGQPVGGADV